MLEPLFSSKSKENILLFIAARNEGYPREIARFYNTDISPIQNQCAKLEIGNVLSSKLVGRTRVYCFNPRYPFLNELRTLLQKSLEFLPAEDKDRLIFERKRPRRKGKPL